MSHPWHEMIAQSWRSTWCILPPNRRNWRFKVGLMAKACCFFSVLFSVQKRDFRRNLRDRGTYVVCLSLIDFNFTTIKYHKSYFDHLPLPRKSMWIITAEVIIYTNQSSTKSFQPRILTTTASSGSPRCHLQYIASEVQACTTCTP